MFIDQKTLLALITANRGVYFIQLCLLYFKASLAMRALSFYGRGHRVESKKLWLSIPLSHSLIVAYSANTAVYSSFKCP